MTKGRRRRGAPLAAFFMVAALSMLTACDQMENGGNGGPTSPGTDASVHPRSDMRDGGELHFATSEIGPNFNLAYDPASTAALLELMEPMNHGGAWVPDHQGEYVLNEDYFVDAYEEVLEDGTQVLHYELNSDAVWNNSLPIDFHTYEHTVEINANPEYETVDHSLYDAVESIDMGQNEWSFTVTMEEPMDDWTQLFARHSIVHPDVKTVEDFTDGFVDELLPDFRSGPFILDVYERAAGLISMVPNPLWWGEPPVLERVIFVELEEIDSSTTLEIGDFDVVGNSVEGSEVLTESPRVKEGLVNYDPDPLNGNDWSIVGWANGD